MNTALYALAATVASAAVVGACHAQPEAPEWERGGLVTLEHTDRLENVPSVWDLLRYAPGEHFTRHADMVRAIETVAEASPRVEFSTYGTTHQRRPLVQLTISSPENLANLDDILAANRELADPSTSEARAREIVENNPAVVWFSFGVHGNEASCPEAALRVIDTLASGVDPAIDEILDSVVLALDPSVNPDGHERYVSWYQNVLGSDGNADPAAAEHSEPWPGGRTNHYYFDLNRDWLWVVQPESRQRLARYTQFLPQLHIDHHEQGYTNPYFLGAGDDPYNTNIPRRTRDWIEMYGEANAEAFDNEGRLYSTKERFDYLYPGYGKVLPVYHGAVGMLLEQAGHSRAGLGIEVDDHYTLTLHERSRNHWLIAMSNLQATARHREGQLSRFREYFTSAVDEGRAEPWACVISPETPEGLLARVWDLCQTHGIEIRVTDDELPLDTLTPVLGEAGGDGALPAGAWVIATDQPMGRLVKAVFEPAPEITDRDTYDVTSWSLPATFGLDAYSTTKAISGTRPLEDWAPGAGEITGSDRPVAYIVDSASHDYPRALSAASRHGLTARLASDDFTIEGLAFHRGALIAHTLRNQHADLDAFAEEVATAGLDVYRAGRGITEDGPVLAADSNSNFEHADIVLARGDSLSSLSFGQHWHLLDVAWDLPHTVVNFSSLGFADLEDRSTLVLASGSVPSSSKDTINEFVRSGGVLVASGSAASWAHRTLLDISSDEDDGDEEERADLKDLSYEQRRDRSVDDRVPGALLRLDIDTTHPLAAGVPAHLAVIKSGTRVLDVRDSAYVIVRYAPAESLKVGGSISDRNIERLAGKPFMTAHRHGRGWVIALADDVTFRGFEHGPIRLLLNAILMGPAL